MGSFIRRRYPFIAMAAILIAALVLLLIEGAYRIGLLQLGTPAWEHGATGAGASSSVAETYAPSGLGAGSGYQAINNSQTTGSLTTGGHTTGGQTTGSQTTGSQTTGSQTTGDLPIGGQVPGDQPIGSGTTGGQAPGDQPIGSGTTGGQVSEGIATPELPSSLLVVLGLILLLGVGWLNARRNGLERR